MIRVSDNLVCVNWSQDWWRTWLFFPFTARKTTATKYSPGSGLCRGTVCQNSSAH